MCRFLKECWYAFCDDPITAWILVVMFILLTVKLI